MNKNYQFNPKMYQDVANNIMKYLKEKEMTIKELCDYAELKEISFQKFLDDPINTTISIYDLYKISIILNVSIDRFFL